MIATTLSRCSARLAVSFPVVVACLLSALFVPSASAEPPEANSYGIMAGIDHWSDVRNLVPSTENLPEIRDWHGEINPIGYGLGFFYERRIHRAGQADLLVGAELGGFANKNPKKSFSGTDAATGEVVHATLGVGMTYLAAIGRYMRRTSGPLAYEGELGGGLYLAYPRENIDMIGDVSNGEAGTGGGFVGLGLDTFSGKKNISLRVQGRVHFFTFRSVTSAFPGQQLTGPLFALQVTCVGWS